MQFRQDARGSAALIAAIVAVFAATTASARGQSLTAARPAANGARDISSVLHGLESGAATSPLASHSSSTVILYTEDLRGPRYGDPSQPVTGGSDDALYGVTSTQAYLSDPVGGARTKIGPLGCQGEALASDRSFAILICSSAKGERLLRVRVADGKTKILVSVSMRKVNVPASPEALAQGIRLTKAQRRHARVYSRATFLGSAALSADSRTVVFTEHGFDAVRTDDAAFGADWTDRLLTVPAAGGIVHPLHDQRGGPLLGERPAFFPDGRLLYISPSSAEVLRRELATDPPNEKVSNDLWTASASGASPRRLTHNKPGHFVGCPSVSADGSTVAYAAGTQASSDGPHPWPSPGHQPPQIILLSLADQTTRVFSVGDGECPKFSPDGTALAFSTHQAEGSTDGGRVPLSRVAFAQIEAPAVSIVDVKPSWVGDWA